MKCVQKGYNVLGGANYVTTKDGNKLLTSFVK